MNCYYEIRGIYMSKIYRSGIIPFYIENEEIYMLFMRPSDEKYGGDTFQIAKGKVEDNESDREAALREGFEELGLLSENIEELIDVGSYLGRTSIYLARIKNKDNFGEYHFETKETKWLSFSEFEKIGRNIHVPIVRQIIKNYLIVS